jgi:hypothetical protein
VLLILASLYLEPANLISPSIVIPANILYLLYVGVEYYKYTQKETNFCVRTNNCDHLDWTWKKDFNYTFYFIISFINVANFYTNTNLMVSFGISYLLLIISIFNFNKNIGEFCFIARRILSNSKILIYTIGLLLNKIKNIDVILQSLIENRIDIQVTIHSISKNYSEELNPNLEILRYWKSLGLNIIKRDGVTNWTKRYHTNADGTISPFKDNDQEKSWNICPCKYCAILIDDKIYKCAPLAYLPQMKEINKTTPEFDQYLTYKPISYSDPIEKIQEFFDRNYKSESFCTMCPSEAIKIKNKPI